MKNRLLQILKGTIEYPTPRISYQADSLSGTLLPDKRMSIDMVFTSENNIPMHLFFYSHDPRVTVSQPLSIGKTGKVTIEISTEGMLPGDLLQGRIDILYNGGESGLPYDFTIGGPGSMENEKIPSGMEEFIAFAKEDPEGAMRQYQRKEFPGLPFMHDTKAQGAYYTFYSNIRKDGGFLSFMEAQGVKLRLPEEQAPDMSGKRAILAEKRSGAKSREQKRILKLMYLFLSYERASLSQVKNFRAGFMQEALSMIREYPEDPLSRLLYAYICIQDGNQSGARETLLKIQDAIQKDRILHKDLYCLFMYLASLATNDTEKAGMAKKLTHKYYGEGFRSILMNILEYRFNIREENTADKALSALRQYYATGGADSFIYQETSLILEKNRKIIRSLDEFELMSMLYGLRHDLISKDALFAFLSNNLDDPRLLPVYMQILKTGYAKFGSIEFLEAVISILLQSERSDRSCFRWYREAVEKNVRMPGLYEYYLMTAPRDRDLVLSRDCVLYFGYAKQQSSMDLDFLYYNVQKFYQEDETIRPLYRDRIRGYADECIRKERYSVFMIPAFREILDEPYLNEGSAEGLLEALYLYEIHTTVEDPVKLVVHYPQLSQETEFSMDGQEALVPIFSTQAVIAVVNRNGERQFDPYLSMEKAFENEELKKQCLRFVKPSVLLNLSQADNIPEAGAIREQDLFLITDLIRNPNINTFYRTVLYESLIDLSNEPSMQHVDCIPFLLEADFAAFSREYRSRLIESLIDRRYFEEAYEKVLSFGPEEISAESLRVLTEEILSTHSMKSDETLGALCYLLYTMDQASPSVYEYLARTFSGSTQDMMKLLRVIRKKKLPAFDLVERTMLFSFYAAASDKNLDALFEWYIGDSRRDESLVKSYLILRSHEYFMDGRAVTPCYQEELKKQILKNQELALPKIGLLAALKLLSSQKELDEADRSLAQTLLKKAVDDNIVLACFRDFEGKAELPSELEGRVYVEYRTDDAAEVAVVGQILPVRKYFHRTLTQVYPGVYVRSFILYRQEWIEFYYSVHKKNGEVFEEEGHVVANEAGVSLSGTRYEDIQRLQKIADKGTLRDCSELMRTLLLKDAMIEDIFGKE